MPAWLASSKSVRILHGGVISASVEWARASHLVRRRAPHPMLQKDNRRVSDRSRTGAASRLPASVRAAPSPMRQRAMTAAGPTALASSARAPASRGTSSVAAQHREVVGRAQSGSPRRAGSPCGIEAAKVEAVTGSGMRLRCSGSANCGNFANSRRRPSRTASASSPLWSVKNRNGGAARVLFAHEDQRNLRT